MTNKEKLAEIHKICLTTYDEGTDQDWYEHCIMKIRELSEPKQPPITKPYANQRTTRAD